MFDGGHTVPPQGGPAAQGQQPRGFAVAAIVLGGAAFLTGLVPVLGLLLAIAAVTFGVVALVKGQPKAMAVTALVLGGIALLTGLFSTIGGLAGAGTPTASETTSAEATSEASPPVETEEAAAPAEEAVEPEPEPEPEATEAAPPASAAPAASGTIENPAPQPYVAKGFLGGEKYSLTGRVVDGNANALVESYNMFNSDAPAGYKYVVVELSMTGLDPDGVEPSLASYDLSLATPEGNRYDSEFITFGDGLSSMSDGPTLYPGSAFTGYSAYIVPESAQTFFLYDNGSYIAF